jgi:hypothetical protein
MKELKSPINMSKLLLNLDKNLSNNEKIKKKNYKNYLYIYIFFIKNLKKKKFI